MSHAISLQAQAEYSQRENFDAIPTELEEESARVAKIAYKVNLKKTVHYGGAITIGAVVGTLGTALANEVIANIYDVTVPKIVQLTPLIFCTTALVCYSIIAVPISIYILNNQKGQR